MLVLTLLLFSTVKVYSQSAVFFEFFYFDPCQVCSGLDEREKFTKASHLIDDIQSEYSDRVQIERVDKTTLEGLVGSSKYRLTEAQAVVINHEIILEGNQLSRENLKKYVDMYLSGEDPASVTIQPVSAVFAFSIGLFSGLSPCLVAMLSFILSYTTGTATSFKSGILRVSIFGLGFISALLLLGALLAAVLTSIPSFTMTMTWAVSAVMILVGLNFVGLIPAPASLKSLGQKLGTRGRVELAQRYRATTAGLFSLGFLFYFVNLCTAPLSFTVLPTLSAPGNLYLLALFGVGAMIPFLTIGIVAGGAPTLAKRIIEQHRRKIRALSGVVLLVYSLWLIVFYLL